MLEALGTTQYIFSTGSSVRSSTDRSQSEEKIMRLTVPVATSSMTMCLRKQRAIQIFDHKSFLVHKRAVSKVDCDSATESGVDDVHWPLLSVIAFGVHAQLFFCHGTLFWMEEAVSAVKIRHCADIHRRDRGEVHGLCVA